MAPQLYSSGSSASESDSDDDAPEVVSLGSAKQQRQQLESEDRDRAKAEAQARKAKNKARDRKLKAAKQQAVAQRADEEDGEEREDEELEEETPSAPEPSTSSKKINFLDPALFAEAAAAFRPEAQPAAGQGKMAAKKLARAERRMRREAAEEKATQIGEGGARQVDGVTIQHLPSATHKAASLATTAHPSSTSATKFLNSRLYSKKRKLAVLDAGKPRPTSEDSGKKKKKATKGMSLESRILLKMGMDDGSGANADAEGRERDRKRKLLLQAEGKRKPVTLARPLASARARITPASNFAVSTTR